MKWLTIEYIKQHSRIDYDCEDALLELYGNAAEETVMNIIRRDYDDIVEHFGTEKCPIPAAIIQASLILVDTSYMQRTAITPQQLYTVPYAFDMLIKPYMRLASNCDEKIMQTFIIGSDVKILITAELPDELTLKDVDFTVKVFNTSDVDKKKVYQKPECIETDDGDYVVLGDSAEIGIGVYRCQLTVQIPDTDYQSGYRTEIVNINPHVMVKA